MANFKVGIKYFFDTIIDLLKYLIDASKLNLKKIKIIFFTIYSSIFSFNYFFDFSKSNGSYSLKINPQEIPTSVVAITAVLIFSLIGWDVLDNFINQFSLSKIMKNPSIPQDLKNKAIEKIISKIN